MFTQYQIEKVRERARLLGFDPSMIRDEHAIEFLAWYLDNTIHYRPEVPAIVSAISKTDLNTIEAEIGFWDFYKIPRL